MTPLPEVERVLAANRNGSQRAAAFRFVTTLPGSEALPLARSWIAYDDGRGQAAVAVMAEHAEEADCGQLRSLLARSEDYYTMSDLVRALGRLPESGPYPELVEIFAQSAYSFTRARAVEAMAATDPTFGSQLAAECLWDCEVDARIAAVGVVDLNSVTAARLADLAADQFEDADLRGAAARRLS